MVLSVVKLKPTTKKVTSALLSDGREVRVPVCGFSWGSVVEREDIVVLENKKLSHKSLLPKKEKREKKERDYYLQRDLTGYNPKWEHKIICGFVIMMFEDVMYRHWVSEEELQDVVSECEETFVRRHLYEKYRPSHGGSYEGYLKTSVYRVLLDYRRKMIRTPDIFSLSLNCPMGGGIEEWQDFLEDKQHDVLENLCAEALYDCCLARVLELDKAGTGLPGFTYRGLFDVMVNDESLGDYLRSFKYEYNLLEQYVFDLRKELKEVCSRMAA